MMQSKLGYKILLAEKDHTLGVIFKDLFEKEGINTSVAQTESNLASKLHNNSYDLIIVSEVFFRGTEPSELLGQISSRQNKIPKIMIFLSERNTSLMMKFIAEGVDNILWKPIHPKELLFQVKNTLRMINKIEKDRIERNKLKLNIKKGVLQIDSSRIHLTSTESFILHKLFQQGENYLDIDSLSIHLHRHFNKKRDRNSTRVAISRLRNKIHKQTGYELIRNRRSRGYYLTL